jgi:hypothetical protein
MKIKKELENILEVETHSYEIFINEKKRNIKF